MRAIVASPVSRRTASGTNAKKTTMKTTTSSRSARLIGMAVASCNTDPSVCTAGYVFPVSEISPALRSTVVPRCDMGSSMPM